jgi:hypothetical protein
VGELPLVAGVFLAVGASAEAVAGVDGEVLLEEPVVAAAVDCAGDVAEPDAPLVDPDAGAAEAAPESLVADEDPGAAAAMPCPVATAAPNPAATANPAQRADCVSGESDPMINPFKPWSDGTVVAPLVPSDEGARLNGSTSSGRLFGFGPAPAPRRRCRSARTAIRPGERRRDGRRGSRRYALHSS